MSRRIVDALLQYKKDQENEAAIYVATVSSKAIQLCVEDFVSDGLQELQDKFFERVWSSIWKRPKGFQSQITLKIGDFIETGRSW